MLPELTVLGTRVLFELRDDANGTPRAARNITDPEAIRACRADLAELYEQGEDLLRFFEREVAHLPPPVPEPV